MSRKQWKTGKDWESAVADENTLLDAANRATLWKTHTRKIRSKGRTIYVEKNPPDFLGHTSSATAVMVEAKHTRNKTSWAFSCLQNHQRDALARLADAGGIAIVYLCHAPGTGLSADRYVLPVRADGVIAGVEDRKSYPFDRDSVFRCGVGETWLDCYGRLPAHYTMTDDQRHGDDQ